MIGKTAVAKLLGISITIGQSRPINFWNGEHGRMSSNTTFERIRDIIIEAYAQVDQAQRELLLIKADNLEQELVTAYRSKGLKLTANNIAHALEIHKKNQLKRSL